MASSFLSFLASCGREDFVPSPPPAPQRPLQLHLPADERANLLVLPIRGETQLDEPSQGSPISDIYHARLSNAGLPTSEPLELLTLANEAVSKRDALLACKRINKLLEHLSSSWMREPIAQCLARAYLLLGDVFPFVSKFPPVDVFLSAIPPDESVQVAVIVEDNRKSELMPRSNPPGVCSKEFHAEAVMLSDVATGETVHIQEPRSLSNSSTTGSAIRKNFSKAGKTYFARRLDDKVVAIICFPRTHRDADDAVVEAFLNRLEQLFV